jgi:hypothetical protein
MDTYRLRQMSNEYRENAIASGTWVKTGRSEYTRATGEVVRKTGSGWLVVDRGHVFGGLSYAMRDVDSKY